MQLLKLLMEWGMDPGYFHELARLLFISDTPEQEEESKREFVSEGLEINFVKR